MKNQFTLVLFHANCNDGLTAASIALRHNPGATCVAVKYQEPPPAYANTDRILIVDFSYPKQTLLEMASRSEGIVVLDHHQTAEADLYDLVSNPFPNLLVRFQQNKCGATMAWDYFCGTKRYPHGLEMIEDRDLWLKKWPAMTAAFTAGLGLIPEDQRVPGDHWYKATLEDWASTAERGEVVVAYQQNLIRSLLKNAARVNHVGDKYFVELNSPIFQSDLGESLLAEHPKADYADIWWVGADGMMQHSLRSRPGSDVDVSAIAKELGGGGHKHAAGYKEG